VSYRYIFRPFETGRSDLQAADADDVREAARHAIEIGLFGLAQRLYNLAGLLEEEETNAMTADEFADCQEASIEAQFGGNDA